MKWAEPTARCRNCNVALLHDWDSGMMVWTHWTPDLEGGTSGSVTCPDGSTTPGPREFGYHALYDVHRDSNGDPVRVEPEACGHAMRGEVDALTGEEAKAILHALFVWRAVAMENGKSVDIGNIANITKSCLLGRLLYEGRPPLDQPPPLAMAAPMYQVFDPALCHRCAGEKTDVPYHIRQVRDEETGAWRKVYCAEPWHTTAVALPS